MFSTQPIKRGAYIATTGSRSPRSPRLELNSKWTIDGSPRYNVARYINRSCKAKSVLDASWSGYSDMLSWKSRWRGGGMSFEAPEHLSTQARSECGCLPKPKDIAGLGIREWACDDCGAVHDRAVNAANNILRAGLHALAEGATRMRQGLGAPA